MSRSTAVGDASCSARPSKTPPTSAECIARRRPGPARHRLLYQRPACRAGRRAARAVPRPVPYLSAGSARPIAAPKVCRRGFYIRRLQLDAGRRRGQPHLFLPAAWSRSRPISFGRQRDSRAITYFVAEDEATGSIIGTITGVDHARGIRRSRAWLLVCGASRSIRKRRCPASATALVGRLAEHFQERGAAFLDLSVIHDNAPGHRALRQARLRPAAAVHRQAQEFDQRGACSPRRSTDDRAQSLCLDHHQRGAPARHRRRHYRRRGRVSSGSPMAAGRSRAVRA